MLQNYTAILGEMLFQNAVSIFFSSFPESGDKTLKLSVSFSQIAEKSFITISANEKAHF